MPLPNGGVDAGGAHRAPARRIQLAGARRPPWAPARTSSQNAGAGSKPQVPATGRSVPASQADLGRIEGHVGGGRRRCGAGRAAAAADRAAQRHHERSRERARAGRHGAASSAAAGPGPSSVARNATRSARSRASRLSARDLARRPGSRRARRHRDRRTRPPDPATVMWPVCMKLGCAGHAAQRRRAERALRARASPPRAARPAIAVAERARAR